MYGNDYRYAISRLEGTIVRHGNVPVIVEGWEEEAEKDGMFYVRELGKDQNKLVKFEELNLTPVPLGYVNFAGRANYMVRKPMRNDWRQGMRASNCTTLNGMPTNRIPYEEVGKTILNQYPSLEKAIEMVRRVHSVAFHREWAVFHSGTVYYKGKKKVGFIDNGKVVLNEEYTYLAEALSEVV